MTPKKRAPVGPIDPRTSLPNYTLEPFPGPVPAYRYDLVTPKFRFTTVIGTPDGGMHFIAATARDTFDADLARAVLEFAAARPEATDPERDVQLIEGFRHEPFGFDAVLLLGPRSHELYVTDDEALNDRTVLAIPVYRCEFVGDETAELIDVVRRRYVPTMDWTRKPSPRVYLRFRDVAADYRSTGKLPGIESPDVVKRILHDLKPAAGSFVEVHNFRNETRTITASNGAFSVDDGSESAPVTVPREDIDGWLDRFLAAGTEHTT